jgi:hypothetical protein
VHHGLVDGDLTTDGAVHSRVDSNPYFGRKECWWWARSNKYGGVIVPAGSTSTCNWWNGGGWIPECMNVPTCAGQALQPALPLCTRLQRLLLGERRMRIPIALILVRSAVAVGALPRVRRCPTRHRRIRRRRPRAGGAAIRQSGAPRSLIRGVGLPGSSSRTATA